MTDSFNYDVAFSFLAADEVLAVRLADLLRERMAVFIYSERQKELAGKDGLEGFSAVFRKEARVCVVLYRPGWGQTKWTGIEETAIKDRAFEQGWDFLTVIALDGSEVPLWLPKTKIWLGFDRFGLSGAAGVIEARVQEVGGRAREETIKEKAQRLTRKAQALEDRATLMSSLPGLKLAQAEIEILFQYLEDSVKDIRSIEGAVPIQFLRKEKYLCGVRTPRASFTIHWSQQFQNSLRYSSLYIRELDGPYSFDGYGGHSKEVRTVHVDFDLDDAGLPGWREQDDSERLYSTKQLADRYLARVLERAHLPVDSEHEEW